MKYRLTEKTKECYGVKLHRIECVEPFGNVKQGDKGGWIEKESNLSQFGDAWVYGDAEVFGNAEVYGDAEVFGNAWVCGDAKVFGNAEVCGNAKVCGDAEVYGDAKVCGDAKVFGNAWVCGDAKVCGNADVYGDAKVCGDAKVFGNADYIVFKNNWSSGRYFTYTKSNTLWKVGCFYGTGEELIAKAYKDSKLSGDCYKATVEYVEKLNSINK